MKVQIINATGNPNPKYATENSVGMDLYANVEETTVIAPRQTRVVPTGIFIAVPIGFEAQIRPRSGLAAKHGITVLNTPGTIDSDYRGEIMVILINHSDSSFAFKKGERIAQMVISPIAIAEWEDVEELPQTSRDEGGLGHTGK